MRGVSLRASLILTLSAALCGPVGCSEDVFAPTDGALPDQALADTMGDVRMLPDSSPDAGVPDAPQPDLPQPDLPQPDLPQPDLPQPDLLQPDLLQPDTVSPDLYPTPDQPIPPLVPFITFPPRAAMLTGAAKITIKGKLVGPLSNLDKLVVNGQLVTPNSAGQFTLPMTSKWGLNIITAECHDKAGRVINRAQSFHHSSAYYKFQPKSPAAMAVGQGAVARLYQKAIDDGNRKTINDLATILEKVINNTNLDGQIPSTLVSGKVNMPWPLPDIKYEAKKNGKLSYKPFTITLKARSGGLSLTGKTSSMSLPVRVTKPIGVSGTLTISGLSIAGDINISKTSGKAAVVSVPKLKVSYSSLKVSMGSGLAGKVVSAVVNGITSLFKNSIIKKFEAEIKKALPGPVKSFVTGFKFSQSFKLPAELGAKTIKIYSALDEIDFDASGGNLRLKAAVYGAKGVADGKLGSISVAGSFTPNSTSSNAMTIGLRYDTLNQALAAAWFTGALKQDMTKIVLAGLKPGSLPFTIKSLKFDVDALLPPILMPTTAGYDFELGVGDLAATATIVLDNNGGTMKAELFASAVIGGTISLNSKNELTITLASKPNIMELEVAKWTIQGSSMPSPGAASTVLKQMVAKVLPTLAPNIIQKFPIPAIDLSSLGGSYGIPKGTVLKLKNATLTRQSNHLILAGDLE